MAAAYSVHGNSGTAWSDSVIWGRVYPQGKGWAWCGAFNVWAYSFAGVDLMRCAWWFYTPYIVSFAQRIGAWKTSGGEYGDCVLFDWHGDGVVDHVGLSNPDYESDYYRAIEGNTSSGAYGSQDNGGGVWERYRSRSSIEGWADMRTVLAWMIDNGLWDGNVSGISEEEELTNDEKRKLDALYYLAMNNHGTALAAVDSRTATLVKETAALKAQNAALAKSVGDLSKAIESLAAQIGG